MNAASIALYVGVHYVKHPGLVSEATRTFEDTQELFLYVENICDSKKKYLGILALLVLFPCLDFSCSFSYHLLYQSLLCYYARGGRENKCHTAGNF